VLHQSERLEDHGDLSPAESQEFDVAHGADVATFIEDLSGGRDREFVEAADGRRQDGIASYLEIVIILIQALDRHLVGHDLRNSPAGDAAVYEAFVRILGIRKAFRVVLQVLDRLQSRIRFGGISWDIQA